ncbi:hypothetical protein BFP77_13280 [Maribacter sp. 4U21]|uniref:DUF4369 domain-containing protein n=1 Tax=Maribacter sp. 4U21 TaxID=1889779 RepID=UPI000C151440|nr:DUF4369 domain-containing protein [Maribacter sp. 4U21]PIB27007.1 hypothetical protein BFP77_13280 [Maribacter sp. 4U21]
MKKILTSFLVLAFLSSCGGDTENTMTVRGKIKGLKKGTLYFQHVKDTALVSIDSLLIEGDGNFEFKTELESPELFYLYLNKKDNNDVNDRLAFFGESGVINITTNWNTFDLNAKIVGSDSNDKLDEFRKNMSEVNKRSLEIMQTASNTENPLTAQEIDSLEFMNTRNIQRGYMYAINFAINNKDSYVAPYIAIKEIPDANIKYLDTIAQVLTPEVAASKYGKQLKAFLENRK